MLLFSWSFLRSVAHFPFREPGGYRPRPLTGFTASAEGDCLPANRRRVDCAARERRDEAVVDLARVGVEGIAATGFFKITPCPIELCGDDAFTVFMSVSK